jgi:3-oxocholest-4-en-26-oate---CoA ligase
MSWNLADLFEVVADTVPDREAIVCVEDDGTTRRLSYAALDERANRLAGALASRGIGAGDRVGVQLANGHEYLEVMLACFKLRALAVNVNYRYVADELHHIFEVSGTSLVVHEPDLAPGIEDVRSNLPRLRHTLARGPAYEAALAAEAPTRPEVTRSGDDHYVLYTGGTTRRPKGVLWRHEDIFHAALSGANAQHPGLSTVGDVRQHAPGGHTRCLVASPLTHGTGHWMALSTLFRGGTVIVTRSRRLEPERVWRVAGAERASWLVIVGDAFARPLVDALDADPALTEQAAGVTVVMSGGSTLSPSLKADLLRLLPTTMVVDGYGASETGGQARMVTAPGTALDGPSRFAPNAGTTVLDDDLRPARPGDGRPGWLARRGHIPLGYLDDPEATARTFPVVDGVRWAVPGDRAALEADGTIVVFGRGSTSINSGGEKIHPEEVESALRAHPEVFDAVVVGVPDPRWGEVVTAVVHARPGRTPDLDDLARHCRRTMAAYKVPRRLVLVDAVQRTLSGKPDHRWARDAARAAGP